MKQLIAMMQVGAMLECERAKDQAAYGSAYEGFAHCKEKMDKVLHDIKQAEEDLAILWGVVTQGGKGVESGIGEHAVIEGILQISKDICEIVAKLHDKGERIDVLRTPLSADTQKQRSFR